MAVFTTKEFDGAYALPTPNEAGKIYEVGLVVDSSATNLGIGDFVQLMYVPNEAVVTEVRLAASATLGATTVALGLADALATTALATTYLAAATHTTTAPRTASIMLDTAAAAHTADQRILALAIAAEAESVNDIYVTVRYRAARNGG